MSRDNPRSERWAAYYELHENVVATWGEQNGYEPKHEPRCANNPDPAGETDPMAPCWCTVFCGFCDHHMDHHNYEHGAGVVPCTQCPGGMCPRNRKDRAR